MLTLSFGLIISILLAYFGVVFYSGDVGITFGSITININIPWMIWILISALILITVAWFGWKNDPDMGWTILSVTVGGLIMVLGYFIYQFFLIGPLFQIEVIAIAEIPINMGQMIIGIIVSILLYRSIQRYLPFLQSNYKRS
jgi:hypothetical protein